MIIGLPQRLQVLSISYPSKSRPQELFHKTFLPHLQVNKETKTVRNILTLGKLQRGDHDDVLACQASNNNLTQPATAFVNINMVCKCLQTRTYHYSPSTSLYRLSLPIRYVEDMCVCLPELGLLLLTRSRVVLLLPSLFRTTYT